MRNRSGRHRKSSGGMIRYSNMSATSCRYAAKKLTNFAEKKLCYRRTITDNIVCNFYNIKKNYYYKYDFLSIYFSWFCEEQLTIFILTGRADQISTKRLLHVQFQIKKVRFQHPVQHGLISFKGIWSRWIHSCFIGLILLSLSLKVFSFIFLHTYVCNKQPY